MRMLKGISIMSILIIGGVVLYFSPQIKQFLKDKIPSIGNMLN
jgi:hypothetical protein